MFWLASVSVFCYFVVVVLLVLPLVCCWAAVGLLSLGGCCVAAGLLLGCCCFAAGVLVWSLFGDLGIGVSPVPGECLDSCPPLCEGGWVCAPPWWGG